MRKSDLCRIVKNAKLSPEKIEAILGGQRKRISEASFASEGISKSRRAGVETGMQGAKSLFNLDMLKRVGDSNA